MPPKAVKFQTKMRSLILLKKGKTNRTHGLLRGGGIVSQRAKIPKIWKFEYFAKGKTLVIRKFIT